MNKQCCSVTFALIALVTACTSTPKSPFVPPAPETPPEEAIAAFLDYGELPALAVAVIDDGETLYEKASGVRERGDGTPVTDDDAFQIGSITKSMTAVVASTIVDEGSLSWESTVDDVLGKTIKIGNPYRAVTLRQLLDQTSGLPNNVTDEVWNGFNTTEALRNDTASERRRLAEAALALSPENEPGKAWVYSNFNYVVAGLMLEIATGKSWETLIQQRLFEPVGMMHAGFGPPATPGKVDAPLGHESSLGPGSYADNPPALGPAGTVHASIGDLVAYARVYLDGGVGPEGRILSEEALTEMETPVLENYGFGWWTGKTDEGLTVMRHNGGNTFFWALMVLYPERRSAVISMVNCGTHEAWEEVMALTEYFRLHFGLPETRPWEGK